MIKKILVMLIMIFGMNVYASELKINNLTYDTNNIIMEDTYRYEQSSKTLYLTNYVGGPIIINDDLNVVLSGVNVILGSVSDYGIKANNLKIEGGELYLNRLNYGLYGNNITLNNTMIIGIKNMETIYSKDKVNITNSYFISEAKKYDIHAVNNIVTDNNVLNLYGNQLFKLDNNKELTLYNDKFYIDSHVAFNELEKITLDNSRGYIAKTEYLNSDGDINFNNYPLYVLDGINWIKTNKTVIDKNTIMNNKFYIGKTDEVGFTSNYLVSVNNYNQNLTQDDLNNYDKKQVKNPAIRVYLPNSEIEGEPNSPETFEAETVSSEISAELEEALPITDPEGEIAAIEKEEVEEEVEVIETTPSEEKEEIEELEELEEKEEIEEPKEEQEQQEEREAQIENNNDISNKVKNPKTCDNTLLYVLVSVVSFVVKCTLSFITKYVR